MGMSITQYRTILTLSKTWWGSSQSQHLISIYQVFFGMPKSFWGTKACLFKRGFLNHSQNPKHLLFCREIALVILKINFLSGNGSVIRSLNVHNGWIELVGRLIFCFGVLFQHPHSRMPNSSYYCSSSQKPSHGDISGTKRGIIDPLVSKRPKKFWIKKRKNRSKMVKNCRKWSKLVKMVKMVQNGPKWSQMVPKGQNDLF